MTMPNPLEDIPLEMLSDMVKNVKRSMIRVLDMPEAERKRVVNSGTAEGAFSVKLIVLQRLEEEVKRRGLDPSSPIFGPDIMKDIAEEEAKLRSEQA